MAADICSDDSITLMLLIADCHELGSLCDYLRRDSALTVQEVCPLSSAFNPPFSLGTRSGALNHLWNRAPTQFAPGNGQSPEARNSPQGHQVEEHHSQEGGRLLHSRLRAGRQIVSSLCPSVTLFSVTGAD